MYFASETKTKICEIWIHLELIMYGDVFLNIAKTNEETKIEWLSLCDGGAVADKGEKNYSKDCFSGIVDALYGINFPEQVDEDMHVIWEIQCIDRDDNQVAGIEFGTWKEDVLNKIVKSIRDIIKDNEPIQCLIDTIEA